MSTPSLDAPEWLSAFREAARLASEALEERRREGTTAAETGEVGAGGDQTLEIDRLAEDAVFAVLEERATSGESFTVISEERGVVSFGGHDLRIAVDPIDGSLNAKRGFGHSTMSIAVADGPSLSDVALAFVWDFAAQEAFYAVRGGGAFLDGAPLAQPPEHRVEDGRLELLCIETSDARRTAEVAEGLAEAAFRWRIIGSVAAALCQVAAARADAFVNVSDCRVIDVAAAMLIVRESGGSVVVSGQDDVPLELASRLRLAAAPSYDTASRLLALASDCA